MARVPRDPRTVRRHLERFALEAVADLACVPLAQVQRAAAAGELAVEEQDGELVASRRAVQRWRRQLDDRLRLLRTSLHQGCPRVPAAAWPLGEAAARARAALRARLAPPGA